MTAPDRLDGPALTSWARRAVAELAARRQEINELNVFPVPDADTGSNMAFTMQAAVDEVERLDPEEQQDVSAVAAALATGAVKGARGNSGLVLSQVLRGIAEAAGTGPVDGTAVARALKIGLKLINAAISEPVEGTVITVLRAAGIAAADHEELSDVVRGATNAAQVALAHTPSQLKALREAGVVDAGGRGFVILLETLADEIAGAEAPDRVACDSHGRPAFLEIMCHLDHVDPQVVRRELAQLGELGESLIVVEDGPEACGVHVHSRAAGEVIEKLFDLGEVSALRLETLPEPAQAPQRAVVAITPPGSIARLYRDAGAVVVTPEEDTVSAIARAVRESGADEVILLPNGLLSRRELISVERAGHAFEQDITLLPTSRLVSGIAALAVHDDSAPIGVATYVMQEAASAMRTAVVVRAESARLTPAGPCARDDLLVYLGDQIAEVTEDVTAAVEGACRKLLATGGEQVTMLVRPDAAVDEHAVEGAFGVEVVAYPAQNIGELVQIGVE